MWIVGAFKEVLTPMQIAQDYWFHKEDMEWTKHNYELDRKSLNIDLVI